MLRVHVAPLVSWTALLLTLVSCATTSAGPTAAPQATPATATPSPTPDNGATAGLAEETALTGPAPSPAPSTHRPTPGAKLPPGVAEGAHGAVSVAEPHAAQVGLEVLQDGGNAIDAAVAIGFALAVTHPTAGNLGGGGFMVVRLADGTRTAIDYRETAPAAASPDMYLDKRGDPTRDSLIGARAAGIPGTVAGLAMAHKRFGKLPWSRLVKPAVALAKDGHLIDTFHAASMKRAVSRMEAEHVPRSIPYFRRPDGQPMEPGDRWRQPELADSLQRIADGGAQAFYTGPFAKRFARAVRRLGGIWTAKDLANYRAKEREPLEFDYAGHHIVTMPPPSSGGIVIRQILAARLLGR